MMKQTTHTALLLSLILGGAAAALASPSLGPALPAQSSVTEPLAPPKPDTPPPSPDQVADARALSNTFTRVAAQVGPSVVRISVAKTVTGGNPLSGTPFDFFGGGNGPQRQQGMGSGVVVDTDGHILTNNHVVEGADELEVTFQNGQTAQARVVGTDPRTDLALVKVSNVKVVAARLGNSDELQVGEWVIAIGNPFGLDHTVTIGVLSAKNRAVLGGGRYEDFLQTDASINPGNSGGPLVNLNGEVIGINTMVAGIGTGIGFAVPSTMAIPIVDQLRKDGRVRRSYVGIGMQDLTPDIQESMGAGVPEQGALVGQVQKGSPSEKAGILPGDIILNVDGKPVAGSRDVQRQVLTHKIGDKVPFELWRDGKKVTVTITTSQLPDDGKDKSVAGKEPAEQQKSGKVGIALQPLDDNTAQQLELPRGTKGVVVAQVVRGSPAERAGLHEGDVIVSVDSKAVATVAEAVTLLKKDRKGGHLLRVLRGGSSVFVVVKP